MNYLYKLPAIVFFLLSLVSGTRAYDTHKTISYNYATAWAAETGIIKFSVRLGYQWLHLQNTHSTEFVTGNPNFVKLFEIDISNHSGYYFELGIRKSRFGAMLRFYHWESHLGQNWGSTPDQASFLSANSLVLKGYFRKGIYKDVLIANFLLGAGAGWGQLTQPMLVKVVQNYPFEPSLAIGTGIDFRFWEFFLFYSALEYELLHFNGNPSFILDNWSAQSGIGIEL